MLLIVKISWLHYMIRLKDNKFKDNVNKFKQSLHKHNCNSNWHDKRKFGVFQNFIIDVLLFIILIVLLFHNNLFC